MSVPPSTVWLVDINRALAIARQALDEHDLRGWEVVVTRAKTQAGVCRFDRRQIGLSGPLTAALDEETVRDTILHEIAHALVGPRHGHGEVWKRKAREIGCSAERRLESEVPRSLAAWEGVCGRGHTIHRHRQPMRVLSCTRCSPGFWIDAVFSWTKNGEPATLHPRYIAEFHRLLVRYGQHLESGAVEDDSAEWSAAAW